MTAALQKVYGLMEPAQLAALSINAWVSGDDGTAERILAAVPRRTYTCPDTDYQWTRDTLALALVGISAEWWRGVALRSVSNCHVLVAANEEEYERVPEWNSRFQVWDRHAVVLDHVLHSLCKECGLDEPAVREWLKMPAHDPVELDEAQQQQHDDHMQTWREARPT